MDGLICINTFTGIIIISHVLTSPLTPVVRCLDSDQRNYFNMLYSGIIQVIEDLCREGPYQAQYLRHAPCMKRVREDYQQCSTEYQERLSMVQQKVGQTSSQELEVLCCSFQTYLSCSQRVVDRTCGRK